MASRRGHGEGSVYREIRTRQTKDGPVTVTLWVATVEDERDPATGRRRQVKLRAKTKAVALDKAKEHRKRLDAGIRDQPRLTVEQFLTEWLSVVLPARVGRSTVENYGAAIKGYLIPGLGRHKLQDLTPEHVDRFKGRCRAVQAVRGAEADRAYRRPRPRRAPPARRA